MRREMKVIEQVGNFTLVHDLARGYRWSQATEDQGKRVYWNPKRQTWTAKGAWESTMEAATFGLNYLLAKEELEA